MPYYVHDKIISPNIWDEKWGNYIYREDQTGQRQNNVNAIGCENYIKVLPNTTYYFKSNVANPNMYVLYYDSNKTLLSFVFGKWNKTLTTPSNCAYITWYSYNSYGTTYKNDICINVSDPAINGNYYPYNMGAKKYVIKDNNKSMNIGG